MRSPNLSNILADKKEILRETRDIRTLTTKQGSSNLFLKALDELRSQESDNDLLSNDPKKIGNVTPVKLFSKEDDEEFVTNFDDTFESEEKHYFWVDSRIEQRKAYLTKLQTQTKYETILKNFLGDKKVARKELRDPQVPLEELRSPLCGRERCFSSFSLCC